VASPASDSKTNVKFRYQLWLSAVVLLLWSGAKSICGQSALDGFDPHANGAIRVAVQQKDGKILIGGDFTTIKPNNQVTITRNHIARLNIDGTVDMSFDPNANSTVRAIAIQADGRIVIAGDFTVLNTSPRVIRNHIARLSPATGIADSFDPNASDVVRALAIQPDKKIIAGGDFTTLAPNGGTVVNRERIVRLNFDGSADATFSSKGANDSVRAIIVQSDAKIVVAGSFTIFAGEAHGHIVRLTSDSSLESTFRGNADSEVDALALQPDGRVIACGAFLAFNAQPRHRVARLNSDGTPDAFNPDANDQVLTAIVQADRKIVLGGAFTAVGGVTHNRLARINPDGSLDASFTPSPNSAVLTLVQQQDAKIVVGGNFTQVGGPTRPFVARLELDGRLDQTLLPDLIGAQLVRAIAIQPDGKILIGGSFNVFGTTHLLRLDSDGAIDASFNAGSNDPDGEVTSIAVRPNGDILVAGVFTTFGGGVTARNRILRLKNDGSLDPTFDPNANDQVLAMAVQRNGQIIIGGTFTTLSPNGGPTVARLKIARLNSDGSVDPNFNPGADSTLDAITIDRFDNILVGGFFTHVGGVARHFLARLTDSGTVDGGFNPNPTGTSVPVGPAIFVCLQQDDKILVGGDFTVIDGLACRNIARLDATGHADSSFNPIATGPTNVGKVLSMAVQSDGKILVGGFFTNIGGQPRARIARLNQDGTADSFDPSALSTGSASVNAIALQADGKVLAGGTFQNIGRQPRGSFARLTNDTPALQTLTATSSSIRLSRSGASPVYRRVVFESSSDNIIFTPIGEAVVSGASWILNGAALPTGQNFTIRARGHATSGEGSRSEGILGTRHGVFFPGSFVIGDHNAVVGQNVVFWGAQWAKSNSLSGGPAPANFQGFANTTSASPATCGQTWQSGPGNSAIPPAGVPTTINVIVASSITQSGSLISGDISKMAVVQTDPGYDSSSGHAGTGTVISVNCGEP
jgi:uncharacterized delta-60 repeat protein